MLIVTIYYVATTFINVNLSVQSYVVRTPTLLHPFQIFLTGTRYLVPQVPVALLSMMMSRLLLLFLIISTFHFDIKPSIATLRIVSICGLLIVGYANDISDVDVDVDVRTEKTTRTTEKVIEEWLQLGDHALIQDDIVTAIEHYGRGLSYISSSVQNDVVSDTFLSTVISLYTNLGTAYSTKNDVDHAIQSYRDAILIYRKYSEATTSQSDSDVYAESTLLAAQASFYLGMVFQDINQSQFAIDSYRYTFQLDPLHWASYSNLGAVYHDQLQNHREALESYNHAYELLTDPSIEVTDPPTDISYILSQLQYRIGLCISHDVTRQCIVQTRDTNVEPGNCKELAAHAFSLAIEYDPSNESAKHMLATLTADATMNRASNVYVKDLFDHYAKNFEHSLVHELHYTGYERLRRGFDRAMSLISKTSSFALVIDAGCGTGLVGEQFRNVSTRLIGVDLSEVIIEKAIQTRPNLYDEVLVGDIIQIFRERKPISLIIAGDSFIYFGNLDPLFESIYDSLDHDGFIAFTLENVNAENENILKETKSNWKWQLTKSGRFAHRKEYVIDVGVTHGLELVHYESMGTYTSLCRRLSSFYIVIHTLLLTMRTNL
jgi:predicted TPR repeat methyltransferase